jgi:glycosyltransferase involved in cell wall biosynthesis
VPWVLDVRDLWPDVAVALGELSEGRLLRLARAMERRLYSDAAAITTVTVPFAQHIARLTDQREKIRVVPNGTTSAWLKAGRQAERDTLGLPSGRFVWTFAGNLGLAQDLGTAISAAELLGDGFQLLLLGDGAAKPGLQAQAAELESGCVEFRPQVQPSAAAELLRASDALLVALAADPTLESFVPSKLFDFSATGTPVVVAAAGEAARLAEDAGSALTVRPGDPAALAEAIRRLRGDSELREKLGANGRRFAEANLREHQIAPMEDVLRAAVTGTSDTPDPAPS